MALDGLLLNQLQKTICLYLPAKLLKIQQISETELLLQLRTHQGSKRLLLSLHSVYNRINITEQAYTTIEVPSNFVMLLRKQIDGAIIKSITQVGLDRVLHMLLEARNELGDIHTMHIYIELMGKYANAILVNENQTIVDALKRIPPFENSKRTILPGAQYHLPQPHNDKQDPFHHQEFDPDISFTKQFHGFSPILAKEMQYRMHHGEAFDAVMEQINQSQQLYISDCSDTIYFHCIPLTHLESKYHTYPLMKGMDILYYQKEEKVRIKQQSGDLFRVVSKELHRSTTKLPKLQASLEEAMDCEKYRQYGDLLFAYRNEIEKKPNITLPSFDSAEKITIPIDMRHDIKHNANRYYQKYHKAKRAQSILQEQIQLCIQDIHYFESLELQLEQATIQDAQEIREELAKQRYIKAQKGKIRKKKKQVEPHYVLFQFADTKVYLGKNNIQNDYVTWKLGRKSDTWLHAKDLHGSHVIITAQNPSESILRDGAMLAAWFSQGRNSSSVPINYCLVRQLKKIPGTMGSNVALSSYKTIYIDPDPDHIQYLIEHYQVKH